MRPVQPWRNPLGNGKKAHLPANTGSVPASPHAAAAMLRSCRITPRC